MEVSASRVFISYNSADREEVRTIMDQLEGRGISAWFDQHHIRPGTDLLTEIDRGLRECSVIAAFVGARGPGPWQMKEIGAAFAGAVSSGKTLIPVTLPGTDPKSAEVPLLVKGNRFVEFHSLDHEEALDDLVWGITGVRPSRRRAAPISLPAATGDPVADAVADLVPELRFANLTLFVGGGACEPGDRRVRENTRLARALLRDLGHLGQDIVAPIDFVSTCFAIRNGDLSLEDAVASHTRAMPTGAAGACLSSLIAKQLASLRRLLAEPRQRHRAQQLVVTSNLDTSLETALQDEGLNFLRVVQRRPGPGVTEASSPSVVLDRYEAAEKPGREARRPDDSPRPAFGDRDAPAARALERGKEVAASALRNEDLGDLILYKVRGSEDVRNSCTLSTAQYFDFARHSSSGHFIPRDLERIIGDSAAVFFGYCPLDPDLRLLHHAVLQRQFKAHADHPRYALMPRAHGHEDGFQVLEDLLGARLRSATERELQVKILDVSPKQFLDALLQEVEKRSVPA